MALLGTLLGLAGIAIVFWVEWLRRPVLVVEPANSTNIGPDASVRVGRLVHVRVVNRPNRVLGHLVMRSTANGCRVRMTFTPLRQEGASWVRSDTPALQDVPGRWSGTGQPLDYAPQLVGVTGGMSWRLLPYFRPEQVPATETMELQPEPEGEVLGVAIKWDGDDSAYAFTSWSYERFGDFQVPKYRLACPRHEVQVVARAGGATARAVFVLDNQGSASSDLTFAAVSQPPEEALSLMAGRARRDQGSGQG